MVLLQWLNLFKDDATWEALDVNELIQQFPDFFFSFFLFLSFKSSDHNNLLHLPSRGYPTSTLRILVVFFSYYTGGNYVKKALSNHF